MRPFGCEAEFVEVLPKSALARDVLFPPHHEHRVASDEGDLLRQRNRTALDASEK